MLPPTLSRIDETNARSSPAEPFPIAEMYPRLLEYLALPETDQNSQPSQFKHQLGLAMKEIESNRALLRDRALIKEESLRLQGENAQIKADLDSKNSPRESVNPSPSMISQTIPRRAAEQRGHGWDSIAMDLF